MEFGDTVDRVAADHRQIGHAHIPFAVFVDDRQAGDFSVVARKLQANLLQEAAVDLVDDLDVARQHSGEQGQRPLFQGLGQQGVVGVGERLFGDLPGLLPRHRVLVDQLPHQFGDGDGRVGVVQLDAEHFMEAFQRQALAFAQAQHVLDRAGHEEILLLQAQLLALHLLVVGVEDFGNVFRIDLILHRPVIIAPVEIGEVEGLGRLGAPQAQQGASIDAVAEHRGVVGDADHDPARHPAHTILSLLVSVRLGVSAQLDHFGEQWAGHLPDIAVMQPLVGDLDLPAVLDDLVEDAELVADAVAYGRISQSRQRVQITSGQPAQPAVAQPRLLLQPDELLEIQAQIFHRLAGVLGYAEVQQLVAQVRPDQKLGRQVGNLPDIGCVAALDLLHPELHDAVAHREREGLVAILGRGNIQRAPHGVVEVVQEGGFQCIGAGSDPRMFMLGGRHWACFRCFGGHGSLLRFFLAKHDSRKARPPSVDGLALANRRVPP